MAIELTDETLSLTPGLDGSGLTNDNYLFGKDTSGDYQQLIGVNTSDELELGDSDLDIELESYFKDILLINAGYLKARNSGDTADRNLIGLTGGDKVSIGNTNNNIDFASYIDTIQLSNNNNIEARDSADANDRTLIGLNSSDKVVLGNSANTMVINSYIETIKLDNDQYIQGRNNADTADIDLIGINASDKMVIGDSSFDITLPADTYLDNASIRLDNDKALLSRDSSDSNDYNLMSLDGSDNLIIGDSDDSGIIMESTWGGWVKMVGASVTRSSNDDPSFTVAFASTNLTDILTAGMRLKFTQDESTSYFIITKVAASGGNTNVTLYGGTDYDVEDTGTYAISDVHYSSMKIPQGFNANPNKWTIEVTDSSSYTQSSPTPNNWYNLGSISIDLPTGIWVLRYKLTIYIQVTGTSVVNARTSLSRSTSSGEDAFYDYHGEVVDYTDVGLSLFYHTFGQEYTVNLSSSDTFYLLEMRSAGAGTPPSGEISVSTMAGDTRLIGVCAYL